MSPDCSKDGAAAGVGTGRRGGEDGAARHGCAAPELGRRGGVAERRREESVAIQRSGRESGGSQAAARGLGPRGPWMGSAGRCDGQEREEAARE